MSEKRIYLSGLNGLRALAALSVLIAHVSQEGIADFGIPLINVPMAGYGVTLFFVISGFLISFLLLKEKEKTRTVDIKKFYIRRILRIWPLYYLFIIVCVVCFSLMQDSASILVKEMWWYLFFAANIPFVLQTGILILVHLWSIGVEEQFYLFWPWIAKWSNKLLRISFILMVLFFSLKIVAYVFLGKEAFMYRFFSVTRFHCMMLGAVGAVLYYKNHWAISKMTNHWLQISAWLLFFIVGFGILPFPAPISNEFIAVISLFLIIGQIHSKGLINLEKPIFDFVGKISYGIYVIHPLVILLLSKLIKGIEMNMTLKIIFVYLLVTISTLGLAWISYDFYETKFLKLKSRFTVVKSANSMRLK